MSEQRTPAQLFILEQTFRTSLRLRLYSLMMITQQVIGEVGLEWRWRQLNNVREGLVTLYNSHCVLPGEEMLNNDDNVGEVPQIFHVQIGQEASLKFIKMELQSLVSMAGQFGHKKSHRSGLDPEAFQLMLDFHRLRRSLSSRNQSEQDGDVIPSFVKED